MFLESQSNAVAGWLWRVLVTTTPSMQKTGMEATIVAYQNMACIQLVEDVIAVGKKNASKR